VPAPTGPGAVPAHTLPQGLAAEHEAPRTSHARPVVRELIRSSAQPRTQLGSAPDAAWLSHGHSSAQPRTRSAILLRWHRSVLMTKVVSTVSRHRLISSAILAHGPIRATSSTIGVGTAAMAPFVSPSR